MNDVVSLLDLKPTDIYFRAGHAPEMTSEEFGLLKNSLRTSGLRQPIRVTPITGGNGHYRVVDGEKRMVAILSLVASGAQINGWNGKVWCFCVSFDNLFDELMDRFICNLHRGVNVRDMQRIFKELIDAGFPPSDIASYSGMPLSVVDEIINGGVDPLGPRSSGIPNPKPSYPAMLRLVEEVESVRATIRGGPRLLEVLRTAYDFSLGIMSLDASISVLRRSTDES